MDILDLTTPASTPKAVPPMVAPGSCRRQDFATTVWAHTPGNTVRFETLLEPTYWAPLAAEFRPGDRIEVLPEDGTYFAELLVRSTTHKMARVHALRHVMLPDDSISPAEVEYSVLYRGPVRRYSLMWGDKIVQDGFATAEDAMKAIATLSKDGQ